MCDTITLGQSGPGNNDRGFSALSRTQEQELHHPIQFSAILWTALLRRVLLLSSETSQRIQCLADSTIDWTGPTEINK